MDAQAVLYLRQSSILGGKSIEGWPIDKDMNRSRNEDMNREENKEMVRGIA